MAKRGMFGGSRFGYSGFGRSGFKRGFGRASFGRKAEIPGFGVAEDMMRMFKEMQSPGFGMQAPSTPAPVSSPRSGGGGGGGGGGATGWIKPPNDFFGGLVGPGTYTPPTSVSSPYWDSPTSGLNPANKPKPNQNKPGGTVQTGVKVRFRPKLTPPAR